MTGQMGNRLLMLIFASIGSIIIYLIGNVKEANPDCSDRTFLRTTDILMVWGALLVGASLAFIVCSWNCKVGITDPDSFLPYASTFLVVTTVLAVQAGILSWTYDKEKSNDKCVNKAIYFTWIFRLSSIVMGISLIICLYYLRNWWKNRKANKIKKEEARKSTKEIELQKVKNTGFNFFRTGLGNINNKPKISL